MLQTLGLPSFQANYQMSVTPFQPERLESGVSKNVSPTGLNAEFASYIQGKQFSQVGGLPQVTSADGSQLVFTPLGDASKTTATTDLATTTTNPVTTDVATKTTNPVTTDVATKTTTQPTDTNTGPPPPQSVSDNPNLMAPAWQRFSQNAVATDGSLMPAPGAGSPGDSTGPMIPMWMRLAPDGYQPLLQKEIAAQLGGTTKPTDQSADPNATDQTAADQTGNQTAVAQNDTNLSPSTAVTTGDHGPYAT